MPEHVLEKGRRVIEGLKLLGNTLGYAVKPELQINTNSQNPQAIDVAWFRDEGQQFPLMIFEVESTAGNTIPNNPLKVYGQPNEEFEKPLFFFHIIVSGGDTTTRIHQLRNVFGSHNYRLYRLGADEMTRLLRDVLSQHRKVTARLDVVSLIRTLHDPAWQGLDIDLLTVHVEHSGFERNAGTFLPCYARLSKTYPEYRDHFIRYLRARQEPSSDFRDEVDSYDTYVGDTWHEPIYIGLLALTAPPLDKAPLLQRLKDWQERSSYFTMIGPHFRLSQDYDDFVLGCSGAFWALVTVLLRDIPEATPYVAAQSRAVLEAITSAPKYLTLYVALWTLHIAASSPLAADHYEYVRSFINTRGGAPSEFLYHPPSAIEGITSDTDSPHIWGTGSLEDVPKLALFEQRVRGPQLPADDYRLEAFDLALDSLLDNETLFSWSPALLRLLHC